jgi:predicted  nucleic acid-binding Zn-ribbon protein
MRREAHFLLGGGMDEQLNLLIGLQEIDTVIRSLIARKNQLPDMLAALDRRRAESRENLDTVTESLQAAQKNKRDRDQDLESGIQKVEKLKARTAEIKNNKEYQALLKEIETAEQENKAVEDEILVLMEKIDAAAAAIVTAEKHSLEEEAKIAAEQKEHESAIAKVGEELKVAEQERQEMISRIDPSVAARYQRLLRSTSGNAVVEVRGESCSGCFMSIPPQVFVNVKKNENITSCPQCGRILYYKEAIEQENS